MNHATIKTLKDAIALHDDSADEHHRQFKIYGSASNHGKASEKAEKGHRNHANQLRETLLRKDTGDTE